MNHLRPGESSTRRRGAALETAILDAAIEELRAVGYARMSMESVAARAGTGKPSLYRRWPSKIELAVAAAYRLTQDGEPAPDTGSLRGDLIAWLRTAADQMRGPAGEAFRGVVAEAQQVADGALLGTMSRGSGLHHVREILNRAVERGEAVRSDVSPLALGAPQTLLRMQFLTCGSPVPSAVIAAIVDDVALPLFLGAGRPVERGRRRP